jgi:hypothetical protein
MHEYRSNNAAVSTRSISAGMTVKVHYHDRTVSQQGLQSPITAFQFHNKGMLHFSHRASNIVLRVTCRIFTYWIARIRLPYDGEEGQEAERAMQSEGVTTRLIIQ